jgi:hypothetical protein
MSQDSANLAALQAEYDYRSNPAATASVIQQSITLIENDTRNRKRNAIATALNTLGGSSDMQRNALNYSGRNADVLSMNQYNLGQITSVVTGNMYNKDLTRRQAEINDWYYQDKLETLFFLQLFFMTLLSMAIIYYFNKSGFISMAFTGFLTTTLFVIVGIAGFYRYVFTSKFRDSRWWYKRRFRKPVYKEIKQCGCVDDPFAPKERCPAKDDPEAACLSGLAGATPLGLGSILSRDPPSESSEPENVLDRVQNQLDAETVAYIQGKSLPRGSSDAATCTKKKEVLPPGSTNMSLNKNVLPYI